MTDLIYHNFFWPLYSWAFDATEWKTLSDPMGQVTLSLSLAIAIMVSLCVTLYYYKIYIETNINERASIRKWSIIGLCGMLLCFILCEIILPYQKQETTPFASYIFKLSLFTSVLTYTILYTLCSIVTPRLLRLPVHVPF